MSHRSPGRVAVLPATAILVAASALGLAASCSVRPAPAVGPPAVEKHPGGSLFSTIPCAATPLGAEWSKLLAEAGSLFPGLRLTRVEDLDITERRGRRALPRTSISRTPSPHAERRGPEERWKRST